MLIGTVVGLLSGFLEGWGARILFRLTEWFLVLPFLPLALILATILGRGLFNIALVIGVTSWPATALLIRSQALSIRERPYLERARVLGAGRWHQITRHALPNVMPMVFANTTLTVAAAILTETTLSFLGLGDPTRVSWGTMLDNAFSVGAITTGAWWYIVPPGVCVVLVVLAFTLVGQALEDVFNPQAAGPLMTEHGDRRCWRDARPARRVPHQRGPAARRSRRRPRRPRGRGRRRRRRVRAAASPRWRRPCCGCSRGRAKVEGEVVVLGEDIRTMRWGDLRALRWAGASIVFQGALHSLNPVHRIGRQIAEPITTHEPGLSKDEVDRRVAELLDQVGLGESRARSYPHQLSGGQRQRVMIAMALACRPQLIIADEPTTALDVMVQAQVLDLLSDLVHDLGVGLLIISHDLSVLADVCDRILVMYAGRVVESGTAGRGVRRPAAPLLRARSPAPSRGSATRPRGTPRPGWPATRPTRASCRRAARSRRAARARWRSARTASRPCVEIRPGRAAACIRVGEP